MEMRHLLDIWATMAENHHKIREPTQNNHNKLEKKGNAEKYQANNGRNGKKKSTMSNSQKKHYVLLFRILIFCMSGKVFFDSSVLIMVCVCFLPF